MFKKWWFYLIVVILLAIIYYILGLMGFVPIYQCGSAMGPNGVMSRCLWHRGIITY